MEGANDDQGFETSSFEKMTIKGGICYSYRKLYRSDGTNYFIAMYWNLLYLSKFTNNR